MVKQNWKQSNGKSRYPIGKGRFIVHKQSSNGSVRSTAAFYLFNIWVWLVKNGEPQQDMHILHSSSPLLRPQLTTAAFFFLLLQHNHSFENTKLFFLMVYTLSFLVSNQKTKQKKKMLTPTDQIDFPLMELTINDEMKQHSAANCVQLQNVANLRRGSHLDACKSLRIGNWSWWDLPIPI